jgi:hypothetical protein
MASPNLNVKTFADLESTHQDLSYEVLHDMVPPISKFDLGTPFSTQWLTMKVKVDRLSNLIS